MAETYLFSGLKVLDVGSWIAAPVATTLLADFGADVIKVELPGTGDGYRTFAVTLGAPDAPVNYTWQMDARTKRSIALNLNSAEGREVLLRLIDEADVYVTNHSPGMREAWGLTYADLQARNPGLIYASLTAYGEQGPERDREGFDLVAYWSRSGLMDLVRAPGADPAPALPGMGDHPTSVALYAGIVTALLRKYKSGEGSYVHTSLLANGMWSASCIAQAAFTADAEFDRYRRMLGHLFTRVLYQTADDRWLQFSMVRTPEEIDALFALLGLPELLVDPRFAAPENRLAHGDELVALMRPAIRKRTAKLWLTDMHAAGISVALVARVEELPTDPQVIANSMTLDGGDTGLHTLLKHPLNIDGLPVVPARRAPEVGEHTGQVLADLGYSTAEIDAMRAAGAF